MVALPRAADYFSNIAAFQPGLLRHVSMAAYARDEPIIARYQH